MAVGLNCPIPWTDPKDRVGLRQALMEDFKQALVLFENFSHRAKRDLSMPGPNTLLRPSSSHRDTPKGFSVQALM